MHIKRKGQPIIAPYKKNGSRFHTENKMYIQMSLGLQLILTGYSILQVHNLISKNPSGNGLNVCLFFFKGHFLCSL